MAASQNLVNLRAEVAMRAEDLRIARKHRIETGARVMGEVSRAVYAGALAWEDTCSTREQAARGVLITASLAEGRS